jgi:septum formation protein
MQHSLWRDSAPLILASTSTTRRELLASAGLACETIGPAIDERAIEAQCLARGDAPEEIAIALAREKALSASARRPDSLVIGADQVLACEDALFHKPTSPDDAERQITQLSGRMHHLHAGVAIARGGEIVAAFCDTATMGMRALTSDEISLYLALAGDSVMWSVGAYRLEGAGIHLFDRVEGAHSTVLGLPLLPLLSHLRRLGALSL